MSLQQTFKRMPLIAILRGVEPRDAGATGEALLQAGFRLIEVPLNSPDPLRSIAILADQARDGALIGAGTVRTDTEVASVAAHGGAFIVMPHADENVIRSARARGLGVIPGAATPTEGFAAIDAGADALKLFPAEAITPKIVRAWRSVFPPDVALIPVGGINEENIPFYIQAGANGVGLGSSLYKPGDDTAKVSARAWAFVSCWQDNTRRS